MKKFFLCCLAFLSVASVCLAQGYVTTFPNQGYLKSEVRPVKVRLSKVELSLNFTYVTIEIIPLENLSMLQYWTSPHTYVESGNARLPLLGAVGDNNKYHDCSYSDECGWKNVVAGRSYYYTLVFSGRIPYGRTAFTLRDSAEAGRGFSFLDYTISNPMPSVVYSMDYCKRYVNSHNDGFAGIYQSDSNPNFRIAAMPTDSGYTLIYLGGYGSDVTWWFEGDVIGEMSPTNNEGVLHGRYVRRNKTLDSNTYISYNNEAMLIAFDGANGDSEYYKKIYPASSSASQPYGYNPPSKPSSTVRPTNPTYTMPQSAKLWSGTGWSLCGNYIVTNHHVVDGARTITIRGVNGNAEKMYKAEVVAVDKDVDLAIIKVVGVNIPDNSIPYGVTTRLADVGEKIFVLGYPLITSMGSELKLTDGLVSSHSGYQNDKSLYQVSAPVQNGNSGGPLFDEKGNVVGIVSSKHSQAENVSYAIKTSYLKELVNRSVGHDIFPHNNVISNKTLSEQVKSIRNFVYTIICTDAYVPDSEFDGATSNPKPADVVKSQPTQPTQPSAKPNSGSRDYHQSGSSGYRCYSYPSVADNRSTQLQVLSVETTPNATILELKYKNTRSDGSFVRWISIDEKTYIVANGREYMLTQASGVEIYPEKTRFTSSGSEITIILHFEPVPASTRSIDFVEPVDKTWRIYGIKLQ